MSGLKRLRDYAYDKTGSRYERVELCEIADEIERDMFRKGALVANSIARPTDRDGVPIRHGDCLSWPFGATPVTVTYMLVDKAGEWLVGGDDGKCYGNLGLCVHCDNPDARARLKSHIVHRIGEIDQSWLLGSKLPDEVDEWLDMAADTFGGGRL